MGRGSVIAIALVVILIIVGAALYATLSGGSPSSTTSSSITSSQNSSQTSVSSLTTTSSATSTVQAPSTLTIDDWLWPFGWDMNELYAVDVSPWPNWLAYTVYQPLITINESQEYQGGAIQYLPGLATSWTVSPDGTTYTLNLMKGISFSNGDPFNSYQLWMQFYGFYYLSGNSSSWVESYDFFNMSSVSLGPATIAMVSQSGLTHPSQQVLSMMSNTNWPIYVTGPSQIVFHLQAPFNWFLGTLATYEGLVFDTQWALGHGGFGTPTQFNSYFNQNPIPGTGPYVVDHVAEESYVSFSQNPTYWGKNLTSAQIAATPLFDPGHVKNVVVNYKPDDLSRYTDLSTGKAQIASILSTNWPAIISNPSKYDYLTLPSTAGLVAGIAFNTQVYPTNNTELRQAIVLALMFSEFSYEAASGQLNPFVGPEYPAWKQFYDLGNFAPYSTNLTVAAQYLSKFLSAAHLSQPPTLTFTVPSGCAYCTLIAEVAQSNLQQINITTNIQVQDSGAYVSVYGNYATNLADAQQIGQLSIAWGTEWSPNAMTPADYWVTFVSNRSAFGNWAIYSNPTVEAGINAFLDSSNVTYIQSMVARAQAQVYKDAPYAWLGTSRLWDVAGSIAWQKGVVSGFYMDPVWGGQTTAPVFNTVTFG